MRFWCRIGLHKWEDVENEDIKKPIWDNNPFDLLLKTRKCKRCHKKQRMRDVMSPTMWDNVELTKKEKRSISIDKFLTDESNAV